MVPADWDSAPKCLCGPNFVSDLIGDSSILSTALTIEKIVDWKKLEILVQNQSF